MTDVKRRLVDRVVEPSYIANLPELPIEEIRTKREECGEAENEVSFERRLCQARVDILSAEIDRRSGSGGEDLLSRLPEILGAEERVSSGPLPRRIDNSVPRNTDIPRRRVEEIVGEQTLARLSNLPTEEIQRIVGSLGEHERNLSAKRKRVHDVLDRLEEEIVRRYTTGELDPTAYFDAG